MNYQRSGRNYKIRPDSETISQTKSSENRHNLSYMSPQVKSERPQSKPRQDKLPYIDYKAANLKNIATMA